MSNSDILTNFATAIMTTFNAVNGIGAHNAFWTAIGGRLFKGRAPAGTGWPYSVFFVVAQNPDRTFTEDFRDLLVQFSHYSQDPESSAEAEAINAACNDLFDEGAAFAITGATLVWMRLNGSPGAASEDADVPNACGQAWHAPTDYEVRVSMI